MYTSRCPKPERKDMFRFRTLFCRQLLDLAVASSWVAPSERRHVAGKDVNHSDHGNLSEADFSAIHAITSVATSSRIDRVPLGGFVLFTLIRQRLRPFMKPVPEFHPQPKPARLPGEIPCCRVRSLSHSLFSPINTPFKLQDPCSSPQGSQPFARQD